MKKLVAMMVAAAMIFSLAGCGEKKPGRSGLDSVSITPTPTGTDFLVIDPSKPVTDETPTTDDSKKPLSDSSVDLTAGTSGEGYEPLMADETFARMMNDFTMKTFRASMGDQSQNLMVSPLSVMFAFAMLQNGAQGITLEEMLNALCPGMDQDTLNRYLATYMLSLRDSKGVDLNIANSIWIKDAESGAVKEDFLKENATFYRVGVFTAPFDGSTLSDINAWVSNETKKMIPEVLKELSPDTFMILINAICFEGEWETQYEDYSVENGDFTKEDGTKETKTMLHSTESCYFEDENTVGFMKYYKGGRFAFVGLLPEEGISMSDYVASLTTEKWQNLWDTKTYAYDVLATMPEFKYDSNINLCDMMKNFGMVSAFDCDKADFTKLAVWEDANAYIDNAFQMTHIELDKNGTKAAAVTVIEMNKCTSIGDVPEYRTVILDRPYVYAIVDTETGIPVFIGTVVE